ncbi:MAG: hypothetical protein ABI589_07685 [Burkholderiales bacterium]
MTAADNSISRADPIAPTRSALPSATASHAASSLEALRRAACQARKMARQTGTDVIVLRDGCVVRVHPPEADSA